MNKKSKSRKIIVKYYEKTTKTTNERIVRFPITTKVQNYITFLIKLIMIAIISIIKDRVTNYGKGYFWFVTNLNSKVW